jgi:hypothetical protein
MKKIIFLFSLIFLFNAAWSQPAIVNIRQNADSIGLYDKFEIFLNVKAEFINPFDPNEIDITATFISPTGKQWGIHGYYYYAFGSQWKIRFSPEEIGKWTYTINVKDKKGQVNSESKSFTAIPSLNHGPIQAALNKRYLEYRDGTPFYGVGLWYNDGYTGFNTGRVKAEELDNLKKLGVNFFSTFITPLETIGSGLGRYDQNLCGRLDELLDMCEKRDMQLSLNLWFHSFLSETVWGGGNIRWETNPYQQITAAKDFYRSEAAWAFQEKLYRYMIARWGYSRSLGIWFVVDEINGTDGWVTGDSVAASQWGKKVHDYFKKNDPYNRLTTGTRSGGIKEFWHEGYQTFDLAAREIYERQGYAVNNTSTMDSAIVHPLTNSYTNYATEVARLWKGYNKPAILGETGWDHTFYEPSMPGYLGQYHNTLWVCLATGTAMSPFWWAYSDLLNDNILTAQVTSLRKFTDKIAFSKLTGLSIAEIKISNGDAYAIKSNELIFGWVVNPNTDVAGGKITINGIKNGKYKLKIYHTWRGSFIQEEEITGKNSSIEFSIPRLFGTGSHANYIGQDVAFVLEVLK